jgi:hypothetical protein
MLKSTENILLEYDHGISLPRWDLGLALSLPQTIGILLLLSLSHICCCVQYMLPLYIGGEGQDLVAPA